MAGVLASPGEVAAGNWLGSGQGAKRTEGQWSWREVSLRSLGGAGWVWFEHLGASWEPSERTAE